jgi:SAM-dependent methyltransferase
MQSINDPASGGSPGKPVRKRILKRERAYWENRTRFEWLSPAGIQSVLDLIPPVRGDVLELCSGSGMFTRRIPATYDSYTCLDLSQTLLDHLNQSVPQIVPVQGNAERPGFPPDCFDTVLVFTGLHHIPNENLAIQRAYPLLRPGGVFVAFEPNAACWYRRPMLKMRHLLHLYTDDERFLRPADIFDKMEAAGFGKIEIKYCTPEYNPAHLGSRLNKFLSTLMQFAAKLSTAPNWQSFFVITGQK